MGWFGSLQLAYKYAIVLGSLFLLVIIAGVIKVYFNKRRLKKYSKQIPDDAVEAGEERVELNKRELDEGDLFGIRAIQSGYFGGVAQSRPSSIAEDRSDRDSTASNTLLGSHQSPERKGLSPMSSTLTLPLEARTASPLRHTVISASDPDRPRASKPPQIRSTLQPSDAQLNGTVTHDPAVNMFLNVPPSPGATSRPSSAGFDFRSRSPSDASPEPEETPERSPESSTFPRTSQYSGHYIPTSAPPLPQTGESRNSVRPVSTAQPPQNKVHSQSASIVSRDSDATIRDNKRSVRSSIQEETEFSARRVKSRTNTMARTRSSIQEEEEFTVLPTSRPVSSYRPYTTRTSSFGNPPSNSLPTSPPRNHEVPAVPDLPNTRNSVKIDPSQSNQNQEEQFQMHISHLSDTSSVYSSAQKQSVIPETSNHPGGRRQSTGGYPFPGYSQYSTEPPTTPQTQSIQQPQIAPSVTVDGSRRDSDASSHQSPSNNQSANNSHRNTRELGDFYDSYWRHSNQSTGTIGEGSREARAEEKNKEAKRQDRLEIDVPTIEEVETPMASPAVTPHKEVGMAM